MSGREVSCFDFFQLGLVFKKATEVGGEWLGSKHLSLSSLVFVGLSGIWDLDFRRGKRKSRGVFLEYLRMEKFWFLPTELFFASRC